MVLGHGLALVPGHDHLPVRPGDAGALGVGDIAGLDRVDAETLVKRHRRLKLLLVVEGVAAGFVVPDQLHAL